MSEPFQQKHVVREAMYQVCKYQNNYTPYYLIIFFLDWKVRSESQTLQHWPGNQ